MSLPEPFQTKARAQRFRDWGVGDAEPDSFEGRRETEGYW